MQCPALRLYCVSQHVTTTKDNRFIRSVKLSEARNGRRLDGNNYEIMRKTKHVGKLDPLGTFCSHRKVFT